MISWKCRGFENLTIIQELHKIIHEEQPKIIFLLETKLSLKEIKRVNIVIIDYWDPTSPYKTGL